MIIISHFKKSIFALGAFLFASVVFAPKAQALFFVGASYQLSHSFTDIDSSEESVFTDTKNSGFGFQVVFPLGVLIRMDLMDQKKSASDENAEVDISTILYSIGYRFGLPVLPIHFAAALGTGKPEFRYGSTDYDTKNAIALYLEAGYAIIPLFDLYLAYQRISGGKVSSGELESLSTLSSDAFSLGFNFGF